MDRYQLEELELIEHLARTHHHARERVLQSVECPDNKVGIRSANRVAAPLPRFGYDAWAAASITEAPHEHLDRSVHPRPVRRHPPRAKGAGTPVARPALLTFV